MDILINQKYLLSRIKNGRVKDSTKIQPLQDLESRHLKNNNLARRKTSGAPGNQERSDRKSRNHREMEDDTEKRTKQHAMLTPPPREKRTSPASLKKGLRLLYTANTAQRVLWHVTSSAWQDRFGEEIHCALPYLEGI